MGNCGGHTRTKRKISEIEELTILFKKTDTSIDFYRQLDRVYQYNDSLTSYRTISILHLVCDVLEKDNSFRNKFFALSFVGMLFAKYQHAKKQLDTTSLILVLMDQLRLEISNVKDYVNSEGVKSWKERYYMICIEILCYVVRSDSRSSKKVRTFLISNNLDIERKCFYTEMSYSKIKNVQTGIGGLNRNQAGNLEQ